MQKIWYGTIVLPYRLAPKKILLAKNPRNSHFAPIFCPLKEKETYAMGAARELAKMTNWKIKVNQFTQTNLKYEFTYGSNQGKKSGSKNINLILLLNTTGLPEPKRTKNLLWCNPQEALKKIASDDLRLIFEQAIFRISQKKPSFSS